MNRQSVKSSQIESIGYDSAGRVLEVEFKPHAKKGEPLPRVGDVYRYANVPESVHAEMLKAESVGKFFGANVRGCFAFKKADPVMRAIIHIAAPPKGMIQRCARCGEVLTDYSHAMGVGNWSPSWWDGPVSVSEGNPAMFFAGRVDDGFDCLPGSSGRAT